MARKDVDLVIKARDQAGKTVEKLNAILEEFIEAQRGLGQQSERTESSLKGLGSALRGLDTAIGGLDIAGRLTPQVEQSRTALERLQAESKETATELSRVERVSRSAGDQAERLAAKVERAAAAQTRQKKALEEAQTAQSALTSDSEKAVKAQSKLATAQEKLSRSIAKQEQTVAKARTRYRELSQAIEETTRPSATLRKQLESSNNAVTRSSEKLTRLREEYSRTAGSLRAAASAQAIFDGQLAGANANVARQQRILDSIAASYERVKVSSESASDNQARLSSEARRLATALAQQKARVDSASAAYNQLAGSATQAAEAARRVGEGGRGELTRQLRAQGRAAAEAGREKARLQAEVKALQQAINRAGVATTDQVDKFRRLRGETAAASRAYDIQVQAVREYKQALAAAGSDLTRISEAQSRFAAVQQRVQQQLRESAAAADRYRASLNNLNAQSRRAAADAARQAAAAERTANANRRAAAETNRFAAAWRDFYGGSRQSLSLLQRIRGEVLALTTAYVGLFGAFQGLGSAINATQQLEAATSRLNVAFDGTGRSPSTELDFVRRTADRLGIQLGTLATEYSKFQIATRNTNIDADATRKIFTQVAEAARVNRNSNAELSGVFVALTQIVSKGAVQMEELRQQLGDRLPGAVRILADALGVTTAELIKMVEAGEVTSEALIPFGDELERRFGPGLQNALGGVTVALGRVQNAAFQAAARFGAGGFIDSVVDLSNQIVETLNSADFQSFLDRLSSAVAGLVNVITFAVENFRALAAAGSAFIALKLSGIFVALAATLRGVVGAAVAAAAAFRSGTSAAGGLTGAVAGATAAVGRLRLAFLALLSSTGIGLLFAGAGAAFALFATQADIATEALVGHKELVDEVRNAYDAAGGSVIEWQKNLSNLTATELEGNLRRIREALNATRADFQFLASGNDSFLTNFFGFNLAAGQEVFSVSNSYKRAIGDIGKAFERGELDGEQFIRALDDVNQAFDDGGDETARYGEAVIEAARQLVGVAEAAEEADAAVRAQQGTLEDAERAAVDLGLALEDTNENGFDETKANAYKAAIVGLRDIVDDLIPKAEELETALQIEGAFSEALANAQTLGERIDAITAKNDALNQLGQNIADGFVSNATDAVGILKDFLREEEGFRESPYWDVNAFRVGFGSDTITNPDGSVRRVQQGDRVDRETANRDLVRRLTQEFLPRVADQIGQERFNQLNPQQQAALGSIAYNSGSLPRPIVNAIISGGDVGEAIVGDIDRIVNLGRRGILNDAEVRGVSNRRRKEAGLFRSNANAGALDSEFDRQQEQQLRDQERAAEQAARDQERRIEQQQEFRENLQGSIEAERFRQSLEGKSLTDREVALALYEAENQAKQAGVQLSDAERQAIIETTRAKFAGQQAEEASAATRERATEAEQRVNQLLEQRGAIQAQITQAQEAGDAESVAALEERLTGVNEQLQGAIDNALRLWSVVGGQEADTAIEKLRVANNEAKAFGQQAQQNFIDWTRVKDLFVSGLVQAFDNFAQAVANGENAGEAARTAFLQFAADFLRQIAQMILQQAILNALRAAFGGTGFGGLLGLAAPVAHTGGIVGGRSNRRRRVDPGIFASAMRFHSGGFPGMKPGEVPIIAEKGEEVLNKDDPRNALNGGLSGKGSAGGSGQGVTVINAVDGTDALDQALATSKGQEVLINMLRANRGAVKAAIG